MEVQFSFLGVFLLALIVAYKCNSTAKYYLKFLIYYTTAILFALLLLPYFAYERSAKNILVYAEFLKHISKLLRVKWTLRGAERLSVNKSVIIIANHQSNLDFLGMTNVWHVLKSMTVLAKKELIYVPAFGWACYLSGLIFVDRRSGEGREKAKADMNQAMEKLKKDKTKLFIFPEGTRRSTGKIHEFKKGAFHTAIQHEVPIVPVVFSSYNHFIDNKKKIFNDGEIIISALPEVSTKGLTFDDIDALMEKIHKDMSEVYEETTQEAVRMAKKNV